MGLLFEQVPVMRGAVPVLLQMLAWNLELRSLRRSAVVLSVSMLSCCNDLWLYVCLAHQKGLAGDLIGGLKASVMRAEACLGCKRICEKTGKPRWKQGCWPLTHVRLSSLSLVPNKDRHVCGPLAPESTKSTCDQQEDRVQLRSPKVP